MSAPGEDEDQSRLVNALRETDGSPPRQRRPAFAVLGAFVLVGAVALAVEVGMQRASSQLLLVALFMLVVAAFCFVIYWSPAWRPPVSDVPTGVPPDRLFKVELMARGGWLRRFLEPQTDAHLVVADDEVRLCFRRPRHPFLPLAATFVFVIVVLIADLPQRLGIGVPFHVWLAAAFILPPVYNLVSTRRQDLRFPWSRVHSVAVSDTRFHIRVDDDDYPDGFLVQIPYRIREPLSALFAAHTLFHDEEANLAKSILESIRREQAGPS